MSDNNKDKPDTGSEPAEERTVFVAPGDMPGEPEDKTERSEPVKAKKGGKKKQDEAPEPSLPVPPVPRDQGEPADAATVVADGSIPMPPVPTPRDEPDAATVVAMPPVPEPRADAGEQATVIAGLDPMPPVPEPRPEGDEQATVIASGPLPPAPPATTPPQTTPPVPREIAAEDAPPAGGTSSGTTPPGAFVAREAQKIQVGDCLNHIFEVKRFLARGGMGEVFEGINVNTDERVAIKVMLPQFAADEKIVAMFRKEARTLTKLQHEAIVSYRVLAQEPQLGVLYIVTEYIEGTQLADTFGQAQWSAEDLKGLLRRLAAGLGAAHRLGAIHRDMSPDNVLLPNGDIHQAKIIDFGIAKDLESSSATIVGDGFAGKLNYVAPEQLGDYGREVGAWTDVYSLALVILAVANGKAINMSGSLVDAIDKRRKGPDLSAAPAEIRGVLEAMLRPDPKDRLRSMDEVIAMVGGGAGYIPPTTPPMSMPVGQPDALPGSIAPGTQGGGGASKGLLVGGLLAAVVAVGGGAWYLMKDGGSLPGFGGGGSNVQQGNQAGTAAPPANPVEAARAAINSALPSVTCTWLDVGDVRGDANGVRVAMRGVAGDERAARTELEQALQRAGIAGGTVDFGDVAPITQAGCAALDTYRQVRATSDYHLTVGQLRFEMTRQPAGASYAGREASNAIIDFNFGNLQGDFALMGIEPNGVISYTVPDRADFDQRLAQSRGGRPIEDVGGDRYRLHIDADHEGWSGIILISGQGPFPQEVVAPQVGARGPTWQQQFLSMAAQRGWRVEMVWYESINRVRDGQQEQRPEFGQQ